VGNFKHIVSCYQSVAVKTDNEHAFIFLEGEERQKHANLSLPLGI